MAFNLGTPKSTSGFTIPTSTLQATSASAQFNLGGGGDINAQSKPLNFFSPPSASTTTLPIITTSGFTLGATTVPSTAPTNFSLGTAPAVSTTQFGLGAVSSTAAATTVATTSTGATTASFAFGPIAASSAPSTGFSLGSTASTSGTITAAAAPLNLKSLSATTVTSTSAFSGSTFTHGLNVGSAATAVTSIGVSALSATGTLTFAQLEDAINKWTIELEEQGKVFGNQAKHLNAYDRLLITNGDKILNVGNAIEKVKQQQQQLDQELDFVLAQQKELEDCILPLEKELQGVTVNDNDREQTYKLAENIDAQLKQMSEDLKEIIEHLNESNRSQEISNPVAQIGRILNAHMNSLQWIDRNTAQIGAHLDEIAKMRDLNRRNENVHGA